MKKLLLLLSLLLATNAWVAHHESSDPCGSILEDGKPLLIASGFQLSEGPAWDASKQKFIFSDVLGNVIYELESDGTFKPLISPSGYANGNVIDAEGNIWSARHDRLITKTSREGQMNIIVSKFKGKRLNSPNDLVLASDGSIWFTDPNFGIIGYPFNEEEEQDVRGVYRFKDEKLSLVSTDFVLPNGLAFSPDEKYLYVAEYSDGWVYRFDVTEEKKLVNKEKFGQVITQGRSSNADGLKVDVDGNLWVTGPSKLGVFNKSGKLLCEIPIDSNGLTNLAFGGIDGKSVLLTAFDKLFMLRKK